MKIDLPRGETAILFAILFIIIGFSAPIGYVAVAPDSQFVEVHSFEAADTYVGAEEHDVCFERTVHRPSDAQITVELKLIRDDGAIVEEDSFTVDAYFQQGRDTVIIKRQIRAESLEPGEYRYVHSVQLAYYDNRAVKDFEFTSKPFTVYESQSKLAAESNSTGC